MRTRARQRGYVLVGALLLSVVMLLMWVSLYQHTSSVLRVERARVLRIEREQGPALAVTRGLDLLQTGLPPSSDYRCQVTVDTDLGSRTYELRFERRDDPLWEVTAQPLADPHLPTAPDRFGFRTP